MADFGLREYIEQEGKLLIITPSFDFDSFDSLAVSMLGQLSATVVEKQWDADIHTWLVDFEGCRMLLKGEHYSESMWFEALDISASKEEFDFLAGLFRRGF
ncbi:MULTISPECIES: DUF3630 family protein [Vibrio]|uniref:Aminopeptidase N n=1 Tax=Vibrio variabilis TaxID=990271 RepID=A0ABQ0JKQ7_9VIBR|nr:MULTISPECIES: DUF3630 family protein [Vibrio]USD60396.1 DUF3630 family protein [Vibrio sp. SCSIO 43140]GAL29339.1 aminopeptidase N [Vibrio variabilis]